MKFDTENKLKENINILISKIKELKKMMIYPMNLLKKQSNNKIK